MTAVDAIERAIACCEEHLRRPLEVADMAEAASYSLFHFCRVFSQGTRFTPYDYLMRRRLTQAGLELRSGRRKIIDIALDYQFTSAETFSRAFRRVFQVQPNQYRTLPAVDPRRSLAPLSRAHLLQVEKNASSPLQIVERVEQPTCGRMTQVPAGAADRIPALWRGLFAELGRRASAVHETDLLGYWEFVPGWEEHGCMFSALTGETAAETRLGRVRLPGGRMARFVHAGGRDTLHLTLDVVYHALLPHNGTGALPDFLIEEYQPSPLGPERIILYLPLESSAA